MRTYKIECILRAYETVEVSSEEEAREKVLRLRGEENIFDDNAEFIVMAIEDKGPSKESEQPQKKQRWIGPQKKRWTRHWVK